MLLFRRAMGLALLEGGDQQTDISQKRTKKQSTKPPIPLIPTTDMKLLKAYDLLIVTGFSISWAG